MTNICGGDIMSPLDIIINREKCVLDKMIEDSYGNINNDSILKQSAKVDKYIVKYLKESNGILSK